MTLNQDGIPQELKAKKHWVLFKYEERKGKMIKVPYSAKSIGRQARVNEPLTWTTYKKAVAAFNDHCDEYCGIGYCLYKNDSFACVDLDHCFDENGDLQPHAQSIVNSLDSYTERSISGTGLHIFISGKLNREGIHAKGGIEIYDNKRFILVTGNRFGGRKNIMPRQSKLDSLVRQYRTESKPKNNNNGGTNITDIHSAIYRNNEIQNEAVATFCNFHPICKKMFLWEYDLESASEFDYMICLLAFKFCMAPDHAIAVCLAARQREGKQPEKISRADYVDRTIKNVNENMDADETLTQLINKIQKFKPNNSRATNRVADEYNLNDIYQPQTEVKPMENNSSILTDEELAELTKHDKKPGGGDGGDGYDGLETDLLIEGQLSLCNFKKPEYLIDGIIAEDSITWMAGEWSSYKSFVMLCMMYHVVTGKTWCGHKTQQGSALYICGEGDTGVALRLQGLQNHYQEKMPEGSFILTKSPLLLNDAESYEQLARNIKTIMEKRKDKNINLIGLDLIVIDTKSANMKGSDNDAAAVNELILFLRKLQKMYNCAVVVVDHTGHKDKDRPRGCSHQLGAADAAYLIQRFPTPESMQVKFSCIKDPKEKKKPDEILIAMVDVMVSARDKYGNISRVSTLAAEYVPEPLATDHLTAPQAVAAKDAHNFAHSSSKANGASSNYTEVKECAKQIEVTCVNGARPDKWPAGEPEKATEDIARKRGDMLDLLKEMPERKQQVLLMALEISESGFVNRRELKRACSHRLKMHRNTFSQAEKYLLEHKHLLNPNNSELIEVPIDRMDLKDRFAEFMRENVPQDDNNGEL